MKKLYHAGVLFGLLIAIQSLNAQTTINVTQGKTTYRPVVKNNRVLWFEMRPDNKTIGRVSVYVYENGANKLITNDASVLFPGWPDMDDAGNIAYLKNTGTSHEVFLYDGEKETKITNNPAIKNSAIAMGLANDKVYCGYVRIHQGDIVFKDRQGDVYLYQNKLKSIKKITTAAAQSANLGDEKDGKGSTGVAVPGMAHVKYFDFDGNYITWMHEDRKQNNNSTVTIYSAHKDNGFLPKKITDFDAWVPSNKSVIVGKIVNPFFEACDGSIIWQYYPSNTMTMPAGAPSMLKEYRQSMDDARVGYYNGTTVSELTRDRFVSFQSVRLFKGKAAWAERRKEKAATKGKKDKEFDEVIFYSGGGKQVLASYPNELPARANLNEKFWNNVTDVEIFGDNVFWTMGESECFQKMKLPNENMIMEDFCLYKGTGRAGFFRRGSPKTPFHIFAKDQFGGGGEFDRGLFAYFQSAAATRDIKAMQVIPVPATAQGLASLVDRIKPDEVKWTSEDTIIRKKIIDAFSIEYDPLVGCGSSAAPAEASIKSIILKIKAEKQPNARLDDIQSITLYTDENKNGILDAGDKEAGKQNAPVGASITITPANPEIKIKQGQSKYFLVEIDIKLDVCPCSKYTVTVAGADISFKETSVTASGNTVGIALMPEAEIKEVSGDEQAALPGVLLKEKLVVIYKNFPIRCGKAQFTLTNKLNNGAILTGNDGTKGEDITQNFVQVNNGKDARAEAAFKLGSLEGTYIIKASIKNPAGITCDNEYYVFHELAGKMVVHILDMNNEDFYSVNPDNSNPDYSTWKATMSSDIEKLSKGGQGRIGALADGASMLLLRLELIGFTEPPPGNISITINGNGNIGHISQGLGEEIPNYLGGKQINLQWKQTQSGIFAFALYTPPLNFGNSTNANTNVHLTATYTMPGATEPAITEKDITLYKPPVGFVHGFSTSSDTWGSNYMSESPEWEKFYIDYAFFSSRSFAGLGSIIKNGISGIVRKFRNRKIAATRINIVAHSMGGLLVRQHFDDNNGLNYHRKDNFGQGDIYKFISIGVPHHGSPLAWLVNTLNATAHGPYLISQLELIGLRANDGGLDAMCPGSPELLKLGVTHIPSHTIRTWIVNPAKEAMTVLNYLNQIKKAVMNALKDQSDDAFFAAMKLNFYVAIVEWALSQIMDASIQALYSSDRTDLLVTLASQGGGIAQGKTFEYTIHMSFDGPIQNYSGGAINLSGIFQTTKKEIADYVFQTLNKDVDDISVFAKKIPKPIIQDDAIRCN